MSSVTFVGILSELLPSGILPQMAEGLGVADTQVGFLVGVYALASAICAIPLVSATLAVNRKRLLLALLIGFAASNIVVAVSSSYSVIIACRILGGICAGVMWPMIAAYGTRLVSADMQGKAITIIMAGNTLGISIGMPAMTTVGVSFGWRAEFMALGLLVAIIAVLSHFFLPSVEGAKLSKSNSPLAVLKNARMLVVLLLTFLTVTAHYGIYTYITLLVEKIRFPGGIGLALLIFGIGSILSVFGSAKYVDAHLRGLIVSMLVTGALAMALFLAFAGTPGVSHVAFFLWGIAFGPLVSMYQTAVSKLVDEAKDVATSVQSSVFNFSIMIATWIAGLLLTRFPDSGVKGIVYLSLGCFLAAIAVAFMATRGARARSPAVVKP
ncbi:MAG: MFS transporter [Thiobacillus sp.]|uniref:MFS transporter n=1 Tax=Thiobacillus sp. 63-78 TaxID=1895859 RepID=UPI001AD2857D|nr:MFS transporter [Thiobacillus sp. 63-78]MBN8772842.1 MFS transporter [Thiobacillus sp.]